MKGLISFLVGTAALHVANAMRGQQGMQSERRQRTDDHPPNIVIFLVDDLGWNQVGYHAAPAGNYEIKTPHIDNYATTGIELDRGYMTPWCGPSRSALMTGRTNVYNANVSSLISSFDDSIGFVAGLPPGTNTIATAFKEFGESIGKPYKAWYNGKWGIGGTAYANTPLGMGFEEFRGFWGTGIETCDGIVPFVGAIDTYFNPPTGKDFGPQLINALPGYWEQNPDSEDTSWCPYIRSLSDEMMTPTEKDIACKTRPRTLSKVLDLDVLDNVIDQITKHDYNEGPILQVFATAMLHQPIAYPKIYDEDPDLPPHFREGEVKPPPGNDDMRHGVNNAVRFVDDLFGSTMQAIKDAGQWDNTIVYFTTDNGGAIYAGAVNNNYPLRGSKFSPFEGGTRAVQFLSGGWLDKRLPSDRKYKSDTYIFPQDIAPTLLDMAGGDIALLLGDNAGANYGNAMWEYIERSVDPAKEKEQKQKVRKVSYSKHLFFDVQTNRTMKNIYTGDEPQNVPRLWEPIWPKEGDLLMDTNYKSVKPCRPNGVPSDCCYLDLDNDFQESNPLPADCDAMLQKGKDLYKIEGGCSVDKNGKLTNPICIEPGGINDGASPQQMSLWTHMGAAGPFTNAKGQPLDDLPMKCVCESIDDNVSEDAINYFTMKVFTPNECSKTGIFGRKPGQAVTCDGTLARPLLGTTSDFVDMYESEGVNTNALKRTSFLEQNQLIFLGLPAMYEAFLSYNQRTGFTEWPYLSKWPFIVNDSCPDKGITPVPYPVNSYAPYTFGGDIRETEPGVGPLDMIQNVIGLCALFTDNHFFCPSHQNSDLKPVEKWDYSRLKPYGTFNDSSRWEPLGILECASLCKAIPEGTAYIGDGPYGLFV